MHVFGDPLLVRQAIENLLGNALRYAEGAGTGLGLAIVRAIAQRMRGTVEVLPSEQGARLRLSLPLAAS